LAVILPFEASLWRAHGVDAAYVGHPVLDEKPIDRATARARLGMETAPPCVAILPGSRAHEVRRHMPPMLEALKELERAGMAVTARLLVAASLDVATRWWIAAKAAASGVGIVDVDADGGAGACLGAFDAALAASGTATLECALAGAPPVVIYRLSALTAAIARRFVRTPFVALPNIVLGSSVYPELLDRDVKPRRLAQALAAVLERRSTFEPRAAELRARLAWQAPAAGWPCAALAGDTSADRAASLLSDWIRPGSPQPAAEPKTASGPAPRARDASLPP
jgi:lipid-A-disaccharide synthase